MGATEIGLSMQEGAIYDPGESPLPRLGLSGAREWFRVCFAVSFFRLDHSFRGGEFFKGGRLPQAHGAAARARQIVAVGRKGDARNGSVMPVQRRRLLH